VPRSALRSAAPAETEDPEPAPPPPPPPGGRLIGRRAELRRLRLLLTKTRAGHGHVLLVCGEQGIGKTRLLEHTEHTLAAGAFRVVRSHCVATLPAPGYWPWEHLVRQLDPDSGLGDDGDADPVAQAEWLPEHHLTHQMRICRTVLAAARRTPLLLILEDLHLAHAPVLDVLQLLVKQIGQAPVMVVATLREHDLARDPAVRRAVGRILQAGNTGTLRLDGLTEEQSRELIVSVAGAPFAPHDAQRLQRASGGNPFLLLSMVTGEDGTQEWARPCVPFEVREVLHERLSECSPSTQDVLTLCAVLGMSVRRPLLTDIMSTLDIPHTALDDALGTGLLRHDRNTDGMVHFAHGLTRDFLLDDTPPVTRARWHHRVAATLALRFQQGDDHAEIRRHCLAAARLLGARAGVRPLLALADREQSRFSHAEALRWLESAVAVVAALPRDQPVSAVELQLRKRMMALHALMDGYGSARVETFLSQVTQWEHVFDNTQPTGLLHVQALSALTTGRHEQAAELAGLLHELADHGGGPEARSAACYVDGVTLYVGGRVDEALAALAQGTEITDALLAGHRRTAAPHGGGHLQDRRIDFRAYLALGHCLSGDRIQTQRYRTELLHLTQSERYDRPWDRAFARYVDALIAVTECDVQGVWLAARAGLDLAARCQLPFWQRMLAVPLGWAEVHQGAHDKGLARMREALHEAARHRTLLRRTLHLGLLADALQYTGAREQARRTMSSAVREIERRGEYFCLRPQWPWARLLHSHGTSAAAEHRVVHGRH
ncbi:AAA family ATPase, partial [Streptomyces clavuligerus]